MWHSCIWLFWRYCVYMETGYFMCGLSLCCLFIASCWFSHFSSEGSPRPSLAQVAVGPDRLETGQLCEHGPAISYLYPQFVRLGILSDEYHVFREPQVNLGKKNTFNVGHYLGYKNTFNANRSPLQVWDRFCIIPGTYFTWLNLYRSLQRQILWFFPFYKWGKEA